MLRVDRLSHIFHVQDHVSRIAQRLPYQSLPRADQRYRESPLYVGPNPRPEYAAAPSSKYG